MIYNFLQNYYMNELGDRFKGVTCLGPVVLIGEQSKICISPGSVLSHPARYLMEMLLDAGNDEERKKILANRAATRIAEFSIIGPHTVIYDGVSISKRVFIEGRCIVRNDSNVADNSSIYFGAYIGENVSIGSHCKIGGFVCNDTKIESGCAILGNLVHSYPRPGIKCRESAPIVRENVLVSMNSTIIGGIELGANCRIGAGVTVLKNVPSNKLVNEIYK